MNRSLPLAALLVAVTLAGCLGSSPATPNARDDDPVVVEDPGNYTYVDNASFATGGHIHDYWDGQDRIVVTEGTQSGNYVWGADEPVAVADIRGDTGEVVPQGAASVEVTVSWDLDETQSRYDQPQLWVKSAADNEPVFIQEVENGETVEIASNNSMNDLPHQLLSAWIFQLRASYTGTGSEVLYMQWNGETTIHVEAVKGIEIPVYPAHPDQWDNRTEIQILDEDKAMLYDGNPNGGFRCYAYGCPWPHIPDNGTIVPFETSVLRVTITRTDEVPDNPTRVGLSYHGADTREWTRLEPTEEDDTTRVYDIPIETGMGDGWYAEQSLWEFVAYIDEPQEDGWYLGSYNIEATAFRDAPP